MVGRWRYEASRMIGLLAGEMNERLLERMYEKLLTGAASWTMKLKAYHEAIQRAVINEHNTPDPLQEQTRVRNDTSEAMLGSMGSCIAIHAGVESVEPNRYPRQRGSRTLDDCTALSLNTGEQTPNRRAGETDFRSFTRASRAVR